MSALYRAFQLRLEAFDAFSYHSLWEYSRWNLEREKGPGDTYVLSALLLLFP